MGKSETVCRSIFQYVVQYTFVPCRPSFLGQLELDGYCRRYELAFEYNGIQHAQFHPYFHRSYRDYECQLERDERKNRLCQRYGLLLMTIPHRYTHRRILPMTDFIARQLSNAEYQRGETYATHRCVIQIAKHVQDLHKFD